MDENLYGICDGSGDCTGVDTCAGMQCTVGCGQVRQLTWTLLLNMLPRTICGVDSGAVLHLTHPPPTLLSHPVFFQPSDGSCFTGGQCIEGHCFFDLKLKGASCDDGDASTTSDECAEDGTCTGVNLCLGVTCSGPLGQCETSQACDFETGKCTPVYASEGATCNDDNPETGPDTCDGQGGCSGPDLCADVICEETSDPCRSNGGCQQGACVYPMKAVGTPCDDGTYERVCGLRCKFPVTRRNAIFVYFISRVF